MNFNKYIFKVLFSIVICVVFSYSNFSCKISPKSSSVQVSEIEQKIDSLLELMTIDEKIGQMTQVRHFKDIKENDVSKKFIGSVIHTNGPLPGSNAAEWQTKFTRLQKKALSTRLGIPLLFAVDAVHGQNTYEGATIFPHNIGMGASRNAKLVEEAAQITAKEAQATGFNWTFSPCIAIPFNEKWGRVYEAYSESPELTSELVMASIKGHQGNLKDNNTVLATAKHFIGDGSTDFGREGGETNIDNYQLQQLLLPYRKAVEQDIGAIMASFNSLDGINMHAHKALITDTLKTAMNFKGIVVTDWKGYSKFGHNEIINAGVDMAMAVDGDLDVFQKGLKEGVKEGTVFESRIDDAVRRILRQKFRLGLFENPFPDSTFIKDIGSSKHRNKARQAVRESLVLLKNKNEALPLNKDLGKIVVVGEHADNTGLQSGGWTIAWQGVQRSYKGATSILDGIKKIANGQIVYDQSGNGKHFDADTAIIVVGETPYAEFFGDINGETDYQLELSEKHQEFISNYAEKVPNIIIILVSGRPLVVSKQIEQSDAFIAAWLPGSEGDGIAEVLFGDYNFKGKLPHSWPKSIEDYKGKYGPNFWDKSIEPLFEIGFGLTY